ncbi:MAG: HD domain-containing protein [Mastigocoleus sp.]
MNQSDKTDRKKQESLTSETRSFSKSFLEALKRVKIFVEEETSKEIKCKQLYYHNFAHSRAVAQRAERIFQEILPFWTSIFADTLDKDVPDPRRVKYLIEICAIAHDMVQDFSPVEVPKTARKRETGVSERKTVIKLVEYIIRLNAEYPENSCPFSEDDIQLISEAINATICVYDPLDKSIYQPDLYSKEKSISIAARIIALADLGGLGIEGMESFFDEGTLIFLEENIDLIPVLNKYFQKIKKYPHIDLQTPEYENLRQRLFARSQFQLNFAIGRKNRLERELSGLPEPVIDALKSHIFIYLTNDIIQKIIDKTPKNPETNLKDLVEFFHLDKYI